MVKGRGLLVRWNIDADRRSIHRERSVQCGVAEEGLRMNCRAMVVGRRRGHGGGRRIRGFAGVLEVLRHSVEITPPLASVSEGQPSHHLAQCLGDLGAGIEKLGRAFQIDLRTISSRMLVWDPAGKATRPVRAS